MKNEERQAFLRERLVELKTFENNLYSQGLRAIAGVDEVGRGPLAGPVVAAAVVLPQDFDVLGVDDSKKLSEKKREQLYDEIIKKAICWGIGRVDNEVIDRINILEATKLAMKEAVQNANQILQQQTGEKIDYVIFDAIELEDLNIPQLSLIKGDSRSISVAAASIVAKVTRDREMAEWSLRYPGYAFDRNKGYGTKAHYEGLRQQGLTPIHRKSFLKKFMISDSDHGKIESKGEVNDGIQK